MAIRKHTAAEWKALNLTLRVGEVGIERDTKKHKVGDGITTWNELSYQFSKVIADALYAPIGSAGGATMTEDPADPGTFIIQSGGGITEDPADPGTFLIGA